MKLFFMADIHGSLHYLRIALERFQQEKADLIVILGDELYHGARNPLPPDYSPKEVAGLLNGYADKMIAIRGNCDSEVDEMVLHYPIMATYSTILYENRRIFLTHGHIYNESNMPPLASGDVFVYGHTHVPKAVLQNGIVVINPGSITFPKEKSPNTYGVLDAGLFQIKELDGRVYKEIKI